MEFKKVALAAIGYVIEYKRQKTIIQGSSYPICALHGFRCC